MTVQHEVVWWPQLTTPTKSADTSIGTTLLLARTRSRAASSLLGARFVGTVLTAVQFLQSFDLYDAAGAGISGGVVYAPTSHTVIFNKTEIYDSMAGFDFMNDMAWWRTKLWTCPPPKGKETLLPGSLPTPYDIDPTRGVGSDACVKKDATCNQVPMYWQMSGMPVRKKQGQVTYSDATRFAGCAPTQYELNGGYLNPANPSMGAQPPNWPSSQNFPCACEDCSASSCNISAEGLWKQLNTTDQFHTRVNISVYAGQTMEWTGANYSGGDEIYQLAEYAVYYFAQEACGRGASCVCVLLTTSVAMTPLLQVESSLQSV